MSATRLASVYWIREAGHTDPLTEGYIGVTVDTKRRFGEHRRRAKAGTHENHILAEVILGGDYVIDILFDSTLQDCLEIEKDYRPDDNIGWNIRTGGKHKHLSRRRDGLDVTRRGVRPA